MDETPDELRSEPNFSTPKMVGFMAGGILAVVFLIAIVRGIGPGAPASGMPDSPLGGGVPRETEPIPPGELRLLGPKDAIPREGLSFRWKGSEELSEYQVTIYDPTMKRIWSSERITEESLVLPEEILAYLQTGSLYQWSVTGFGSDDDAARSRSHSFRLVE